MFNKAVSSIFGPSSPLRNEPTIDYNNTIHTTLSSTHEPTIDSRFDSTGANRYDNRKFNSWREPQEINYDNDRIRQKNDYNDRYPSNKYNGISNGNNKYGSNYNNLFENVYDDSDEELNTDFNLILNNITETGDKITKTNNSLPSNYPGKFVNNYNKSKSEMNKFEDTMKKKDIYTSFIDKQIKDLDYEIAMERHTELNKKDDIDINNYKIDIKDDHDWESLIKTIDDQNKFLEEFNEIIDLTNNENIPKDIQEKYDTLKHDYLKELKNVENFYKAYYRLVVKYRALKAKKRNPKSTTLMEKIRLIKSTSQQPSVKNICDNLIGELQDYDNSVEYYKIELQKANSRIKELELELSKKS